jgi:uncharacterized UBP type Zn finger protein
MSHFLPEDSREGQVYDLRGVLLHKGTSAHQGHYEAQVYDVKYVLLMLKREQALLANIIQVTKPGINVMMTSLPDWMIL